MSRFEAKKCSMCGDPGFRFYGDRWLCLIHYRFDTMRSCARSKGKSVPPVDTLVVLAEPIIAAGMKCPVCDVVMQWTGRKSDNHTISLQHDLSGRLRLICKRCNTRHATFPGDTFYNHPVTWGFCTRCQKALPSEAFYRGKAGACCRTCRKTLNAEMWSRFGKTWSANSRKKKNRDTV